MSDVFDPVVSEISSLAVEVMRSLERAEDRGDEGLSEGLAALRIRAALDSTALLVKHDRAKLSISALNLVRDDLCQMLNLLTPRAQQLDFHAVATVAIVADRLVHAIVVESGMPAQPDPAKEHRDVRGVLVDLAASYGTDARFETGLMLTLYVISAVVLGIGVGIVYLGLEKAAGTATFRFSQFAAYGSVGLGLAVVGFATMWLAGRHRRAAREGRRLQRQLIGFDAWVAPIPDPLGAVLRATVAEQLFPRLVEDDEPWRRSEWPSPGDLISMLGSDVSRRADA